MTAENYTLTEEDIQEVYEELDLEEEGITEEEIIRRKRRIFVGGLRFASEDHVLHDYFVKFGDIKEAVVIRDRRNGLSKGYGFVTMVEDMSALLAIVEKSPKLDGRRCNVNLAYIGQKKKPPSKKLDGCKDLQFSPLPHFYTTNGYMYSPSVVTPNGQYYQFGLPPLHGYQPMYQVPQTSSSYDMREGYHGQAVTPCSPYQQTVFFPQPIIISPSPVNSTFCYPQQSVSPTAADANNNSIVSPTSVTEVSPKHSRNSPLTAGTVSPFTTISLSQVPPPDIVPITSQSLTSASVNGNFHSNTDARSVVVNTKPTINGNTIVFSEPIINANINNTIYSPAQLNVHTVNGHVMNGTARQLVDGYRVLSNNSVTTFVTSPLPTTSVQHPTQNAIFQYQHYLPHQEVVQ